MPRNNDLWILIGLALAGGLAALLVWAVQRIRSRHRAELPLERLGEVIEHAVGAIRRPD